MPDEMIQCIMQCVSSQPKYTGLWSGCQLSVHAQQQLLQLLRTVLQQLPLRNRSNSCTSVCCRMGTSCSCPEASLFLTYHHP